MPYTLLPSLLLQILIVGYTPGPANIYSLAMSLRYGRKRSLIMWLGLLTGFLVAVTVMAVLTHLVGVAFGEYVGLLKYIGAAYILYLAINRILLKKRQNLRSVIVHFRVAHLYMHCHPTFSLDVFYLHRYCREYSTLYFSSSNIH